MSGKECFTAFLLGASSDACTCPEDGGCYADSLRIRTGGTIFDSPCQALFWEGACCYYNSGSPTALDLSVTNPEWLAGDMQHVVKHGAQPESAEEMVAGVWSDKLL